MKYIFLATLLLSCTAFGKDYTHGVGVLHTYGGVIGYQFGIIENRNKLRLAVGAIGGTVGLERNLAGNISIGATYGMFFPLDHFSSVDLTYYSNPSLFKGFNVGLSLENARAGRWIRSQSSSVFGDRADGDKYEQFAVLSLGYIF